MGKNKNKKKSRNAKSRDYNNTSATSEIDEVVSHDTDSVGNDLENTASKRKIENDFSDHEVKRKKKKKVIVPEEPTGKGKKKSIRQMKREKFAQRQAEAEAANKDVLKSQCITYLSQWKHDRQNWKFMKAKQEWLFKNKFSTNLLPDSSWPVLLEYFESAQGNIRKRLLDDANKIIKQMDDWTESQGKGDKPEAGESEETEENDQEITKPSDTVYNRARSLIQCLEE